MTDTVTLPIIETAKFLSGDIEGSKEECKRLAETMREFGVAIIRDPRVCERDNEVFIDMLEKYFEQDLAMLMKDTRPDLHYQVGATPELTEVPRNHLDKIEKIPEMCRPLKPVGADPKWRFFWRMGSRPEVTKFEQLNAEPVIPDAFVENWANVMNKWGELLLFAVTTTAEMLAIGMELPKETFSAMMINAPHLLAPTATDLQKYGTLGTVLAGYHYDLNFLTIHGKSRYPALNIFLRDDSTAERKKRRVVVPDGCLLIQSGKQIEWLTGGYIQAGYHEVIVFEATEQKIKEKKEKGESLWRISSTLFSHIASDQILQPIGKFSEEKNASLYPPTYCGDYVTEELKAIKLGSTK